MPAVAAMQAQKAVSQDAAFEQGVELVLDELRRAGAGYVLRLLEEGGGVLPYQAVQRGLLGAVALLLNRGAVRRHDRRIELLANGLHAGLPRG